MKQKFEKKNNLQSYSIFFTVAMLSNEEEWPVEKREKGNLVRDVVQTNISICKEDDMQR